MVVLNRIYTRTGDDGTTALGNGERRKKYDLRVARLRHARRGQCGDRPRAAAHRGRCRARRHAGAHPERPVRCRGRPLHAAEGKGPGGARLTVTDAQVDWLEQRDRPAQCRARAAASRSCCPAARPAAAYLHLARTVCRRAERLMVELNDKPGESVSPAALQIRQPAVGFPVRRQPLRQRQGRARRAVGAGPEPLSAAVVAHGRCRSTTTIRSSSRSTPIVTWGLIALNLGVFFCEARLGSPTGLDA